MQLVSAFCLAEKIAEGHHLSLREYLHKFRPHFLFELTQRQLYVENAQTGTENIKVEDLTFCNANQIFFAPGKSVAQHYAQKGKRLQHPNFPCVAVKRSAAHYDFFPIEHIFYVAA